MESTQNLNVFFESAKAALAEYGQLTAETAKLKEEKDSLESNVRSQKKRLQETLDQTYDKRLREIDKTYDGEIAKCTDSLKRAKAKRGKAKNQGIKERIAEETSPVRAEIKDTQNKIKNEMKKAGIPAYCNSDLFMSLFMPDCVKDYLLLLLAFVVVFFLIPFGIWKLLFDGNVIALVIIYLIDIFVFAGSYIVIGQNTVMKYHSELILIRKLRKSAAEAKKKVGEISDYIKNDNNEAHYDLATFDDEIAHITQQLADITMKKNEAIGKFENVTKNIITEEITSNAKPEIDEAEKKLAEITVKYNETEAARKAKALELSNEYEVYLGKEFMTKNKIDALKEIVDHGTASNVSEAIEEYYRQTDI